MRNGNGNGIVKELAVLASEAGLKGDFGLGSPNEMPPLLALLRFIWELINPFTKRHGYAPQNGMKETRASIAERNREEFGIELDPDKNITIVEGTRGAIPDILKGHVGKVVLPVSYYPGHLDAIMETGCEPVFIPMPSVQEFIKELMRRLMNRNFRPSAVILSFDNPRWLPRTHADYSQLVSLAKAFEFVLVSDEAYRELSYGGVRVESILRVKKSCLEVAYVTQSGSKAFCAAGWKVGAVIASPDWVAAVTARKAKRSEGGCIPVQLAYATALLHCRAYPGKIAERYRRRAALTIRLLQQAGLRDIKMSHGGMFLYFKVPGDCEQFAREMAKCGYLVRPGPLFGEDGYIRWCLREPDQVTQGACAAVAGILQQRFAASTAVDILELG